MYLAEKRNQRSRFCRESGFACSCMAQILDLKDLESALMGKLVICWYGTQLGSRDCLFLKNRRTWHTVLHTCTNRRTIVGLKWAAAVACSWILFS